MKTRLRDTASQLPLAAGASSCNLVFALYLSTVLLLKAELREESEIWHVGAVMHDVSRIKGSEYLTHVFFIVNNDVFSNCNNNNGINVDHS